MTTVVERHLTGPATHAFVVGVSHYRHLPGGSGPVSEIAETMELQQVDMPALSAVAFAAWLNEEYNNSDAPLASIEMLVSSSSPVHFPAGGEGQAVEGATLSAVREAFSRWYKRCDSDEKNVAIFYFCGHGFARNSTFLLLEDWAAYEETPMHESIDLDRFHRGMGQCRSKTQLYFADACRSVDYTLTTTVTDSGTPLIQPNDMRNRPGRSAPVFYAAGDGQKAFGIPGQQTYFTKVLLMALRGAAAGTWHTPPSDGWCVDTYRLGETIAQLLQRETPLQTGQTDGFSLSYCLTRLGSKPIIPVGVECAPPPASEYATLKLQSPNQVFERPPEPGTWRITAPMDNYQLSASFIDNRYPAYTREVPILPPYTDCTIPAGQA
ncbi:caspase family protein [Streptomyces iakyrus]|uniref:caspase family protein n=1 Tax=Streptomyces iakyrus TaxID=68219 RepID=UPI003D93F001